MTAHSLAAGMTQPLRIALGAVGRAAIVFCAFWGSASESRAQVDRPLRAPAPLEDPALQAKLSWPGDLTLRDTPLASALFTISELWEINIVVGHEVDGHVHGVFRRAPLYEILDSILLSNGYGYRLVGESLVVMRLEALGDLNPMFETATIALEHSDPAQILDGVSLLSSPQGKVHAVPAARSLMVLDFPERVAMMRKLVHDLEQAARQTAAGPTAENRGPLRVVGFSPQYAAASSMKESLDAVLSPDGKVAVVDPDNRLVVVDYEDALELARQVVQQLDVPRQQVRITALIYDLDLQDIERLGLNWSHALKARPDANGDARSLFSLDSLITAPAGSGAPDVAMKVMSLSQNFDVTAVARALQQAKDSRLLADPNITVLDHEKALISIVTEIPYQQLTQTQQGGSIGTTAFREAGVKLEVTPHIAEDGTIRMEVTPSFSRLTGYTPGEQAQPIIDTREAKTVVRVANGQVLVIGGLRQRTDTGDFSGLPYLKDIQFLNLGALFRGRETQIRESELVVFIMPEIISTCQIRSYRDAEALQSGQCLLDNVPTAGCGPPPYRPVPRRPPLPIGGPRPSSASYPYEVWPQHPGIQIEGEPVAAPQSVEPVLRPAPQGPTGELGQPILGSPESSASAWRPGAASTLRRGYDERFRASDHMFPDGWLR